MEKLHSLTTDELIDILSTQTSLYVIMHAEGASEEDFEKCRVLLKEVQAEIKSRITGK